MCMYSMCLLFFKQKTAYEMRISDWSSDVCSSDLRARSGRAARPDARGASEPARAGRAKRTGRKRECRTPPGRRAACLRLRAEGALRTRRSAWLDGFRDGGEAVGRALRRADGCARPHGTGACQFHAGPAHDGVRLYRGRAAGAGPRRNPLRNGPASEIRRGRSEEHTSELQSLMRISYAVFCLKKKTIKSTNNMTNLTHVHHNIDTRTK